MSSRSSDLDKEVCDVVSGWYMMYPDVALIDMVLDVELFHVYDLSTFCLCCVFGDTDRSLIVNHE